MSAVELQSQDHRDLLDIIDKLRSVGIARYIDLPQIVVCGDQSSGKSSVLEAISGLSFPAKDNLCTRFPTELVLRRDSTSGVRVSIIPGPTRTPQEIEALSRFHHEVDIDKPDLSSVIEQAKKVMGIPDHKGFSDDILRVELKGPGQPHLTLVDLPGLFRAGNRDQTVDNADIVDQMVRNYMGKPRSIILAVVSAQSDIALQPITELSRKLDPNRLRTLGLITKPDMLPKGSDSEASYVALARNKDVVFHYGWHVLRNRSFETRTASSAERDQEESNFFADGLWARLDRNTVGIHALRPRLSIMLRNLILQQLPSLIRDVASGQGECEEQLERLGGPRGSLFEQRQYLRHVSWRFSLLMRAAVDGFYTDAFFGQASTETGYQKRLRAVVQNELESFADTIRLGGRSQIIDDEEVDHLDKSSTTRVSRSEYLAHVEKLMRRSRGCELPGTFNPLIIGELFREQCRPWEGIVQRTQDTVIQVSRRISRMIMDSVAVPEIVSAVSAMLDSKIDNLESSVKAKTEEILQPFLTGHPITYNHYLTDTVQKIQSERSRRTGVEVNMKTYASQLATDYMQAYYKVAMKRFVDDVSVFSVEELVMRQLPRLFDVDAIDELSDDEVGALAGESETTVSDRKHNEEKLATLETAMQELQRLHRHYHALSELPTTYENDMKDNSLRSVSPTSMKHHGELPTLQPCLGCDDSVPPSEADPITSVLEVRSPSIDPYVDIVPKVKKEKKKKRSSMLDHFE